MSTKGRNNKLNIGDIVEMKNEIVKYYVENINCFYLVPGDKEIRPEDYPKAAGFYHALLTGSPVRGKVTGYAGTDSGPKPWNSKKWVDLKGKNVIRVTLKLKYGNYETLLSERDLKKV